MISTEVLREERKVMGGKGEERMRGKVEQGGGGGGGVDQTHFSGGREKCGLETRLGGGWEKRERGRI